MCGACTFAVMVTTRCFVDHSQKIALMINQKLLKKYIDV